MVQWWYEFGFLSNTLIALSHSCSMGFRFVAQANDQFVKQYSMWDRIIQWRYDFAALTEEGSNLFKMLQVEFNGIGYFLDMFLKIQVRVQYDSKILEVGD